jgi:DNA polymerase-1
MIDLIHDKRLKELGFRLLVPVHDEVIAECPRENVKECATRLAQVMSHAAEKVLEMPIKCDVEVTREWYGKEIEYEE